jgi:regulator of protease activity HflC (stomatin/prohibitin superfamily)
MKTVIVAAIVALVLLALVFALAVRIIRQYERGVVFRFGGLLAAAAQPASAAEPGTTAGAGSATQTGSGAVGRLPVAANGASR